MQLKSFFFRCFLCYANDIDKFRFYICIIMLVSQLERMFLISLWQVCDNIECIWGILGTINLHSQIFKHCYLLQIRLKENFANFVYFRMKCPSKKLNNNTTTTRSLTFLDWCILLPFTALIKYFIFVGSHSVLLGIVNSFVHVFMYGYYFLTSFKPELKESIWWKKHITQIQIVRFFFFDSQPTCKNFPSFNIRFNSSFWLFILDYRSFTRTVHIQRHCSSLGLYKIYLC